MIYDTDKLYKTPFPTEFARRLAEGNLLPVKRSENVEKYDDLYHCLQTFQRFALKKDFDACLVAYTNIKLTIKQTSILKVIFENTKDDVFGEVVSNLIKIASGKDQTSDRLAVEAAKEALSNLQKNGNVNNDQKRLIVEVIHKETSPIAA